MTPEQDATLTELLVGLRNLNNAVFNQGAGTANPSVASAVDAKIKAIVAAELAKLPAGSAPGPRTLTGTINGTVT